MRSASLLRTRGRAGGSRGLFLGAIVHRVMRRPVVSLVLAAACCSRSPHPCSHSTRAPRGCHAAPTASSRQLPPPGEKSSRSSRLEPVEIAVAGEVREPAVKRALAEPRARARPPPDLRRGDRRGERGRHGRCARRVPIAANPDGERAIAAVRELRSEAVPWACVRGGRRRGVRRRRHRRGADYHNTVNFWLPLVLTFVPLSFLLLTLAFRSIVVPATAIGMNLLSVGAAYGLLVLVFQEGIGNELRLRDAETTGRLGAALSLRRPLRAFDGLPGLLAQPHPRALRTDGRHGRCHLLRYSPARPLASSRAPRSSSSPSSGASRWETRSPFSRWASASH